MAWKYRYLLWITLLHMISSLETGEPERNWESESRKLSGAYKIVNRRMRPPMNKRGTGESGFVFPGLSSRVGQDTDIEIPDDCKNIGICEDIPNYPEDLVKSLISDLEKRNGSTIFNNDVLFPPQVAERIGDDDNIELCKSSERIFTPKAAKTSSDKWRVILNSNEKPLQTFRVEVCHKGRSPCEGNDFLTFQTSYTGSCVQKYALREMVAIDDNGNILKDSFQVPTCCSCVAKSL